MHNKYVYLFLKDAGFRTVCILSVLGIIFCFVLIRLDLWQNLSLKDIQHKQAVIAQIPALEAKIAQLKGAFNGLTLNGIISDKAQPMASINNTLVKVGDIIDGKKVVTITGHSATVCNVESNNKCVTLLLDK